jgi:hypothetical protein
MIAKQDIESEVAPHHYLASALMLYHRLKTEYDKLDQEESLPPEILRGALGLLASATQELNNYREILPNILAYERKQWRSWNTRKLVKELERTHREFPEALWHVDFDSKGRFLDFPYQIWWDYFEQKAKALGAMLKERKGGRYGKKERMWAELDRLINRAESEQAFDKLWQEQKQKRPKRYHQWIDLIFQRALLRRRYEKRRPERILVAIPFNLTELVSVVNAVVTEDDS